MNALRRATLRLNANTSPAPERPRWFGWISLIVLVVIGSYLVALSDGRALATVPTSQIALPLDDAYIHLNYTRAILQGHPFQYVYGQAATSGATSLLYPFLLLPTALAGTSWVVVLGAICMILTGSRLLQLGASGQYGWPGAVGLVVFLCTGSLGFAFFSGMETGVFIAAMIQTVFALSNQRLRWALFWAGLCALIRPEGAIVALTTCIYVLFNDILMGTRNRPIRSMLANVRPFAGWITFVLVACAAQPLINLLLTGSLTASGLQAKSYLYNVPFDVSPLLNQFGQNLIRAWSEFFAPIRLPLMVAAIYGLITAVRRRTFGLPVLLLLWIVLLSLSTSLLETAFWQFGRYQQPSIVLWIVLAVFGARELSLSRIAAVRMVCFAFGCAQAMIFFTLDLQIGLNAVTLNTKEIASSQMQMAADLQSLTPPDAVIGVHDVGTVAFLSGRPTYDLIGLTTPGLAASAARQGAGAIYETMLNSGNRPEYFAIYNDARALSYFQNTDVYAKQIAAYPSTFTPDHPLNFASATASGQFLYRANWSRVDRAAHPGAAYSASVLDGLTLTDSLNAADLNAERAHGYAWHNINRNPGFVTEFFQMSYPNCANPEACTLMDGGRIVTGGESFTMQVNPGQDGLLITRVHSYREGRITIHANGQPIGTRVIPEQPGQWFEFAVTIPARLITSDRVQIEVSVENGVYMPYHHWFFSGATASVPINTLIATMGAGISLHESAYQFDPVTRRLTLDLRWSRDTTVILPESQFDAKLFIHLYRQDGDTLTLLETAQYDGRVALGTPPQNWLNAPIAETIQVQIPPDTPFGTYRIAIGLYAPTDDQARFPVSAVSPTVTADSDRRLFIGTITIEEWTLVTYSSSSPADQ